MSSATLCPLERRVYCKLSGRGLGLVSLKNPNHVASGMFCLAFDQTTMVALGIFTGRENTDADFSTYVDSFQKLDAIASRSGGLRACYVLIVDPGNPPPDALWRKRIADASANIRSDPLVSIVTSSALIRGVATAINWLRPPPFEIRSHETVAIAAAWIDARRAKNGDALGVLTRLEREARAVSPAPPTSRRGGVR